MGNKSDIHLSLRDVDSYGNFFKANYHTACLVAGRYIADTHEAEDIVQEVFIKIWEKRDDIRIHSTLKHYLFNSVKNASINYVQRKKDLTTELSLSDIKNSTEEKEDRFVSEEFAAKIDQAIETLPPQCKRIFLLAFIENRTYQEIADTLGLSKNTVKTQMGVAYKLLREKLHDSFFNLFFLLLNKSNSAFL